MALSTTYHPQTNGETEWVNQELETYLRLFTLNKPENGQPCSLWQGLPITPPYTLSLKNPFSLMMGYEPQAYSSIGKTFLPNLEKRLSDLSATCDDAKAAHCYTVCIT